MSSNFSRRQFIGGIGVAAASSALSGSVLAELEPMYPPMDLSYFDKPITRKSGQIHIGYAAITWGGKDQQAIEDIASLGYPGIQLRSNVVEEFKSPAELHDLLEKNHLQMVALSSGGVRLDPAIEAEELAKHSAHAKFVHDVGGLYLQVTDQRPQGRAVTADDYRRLGRLLTAIGRRTADLGIPLGYHNHMGSLGERPEEVDQILAAADPRYVRLELDIAHYFQGGGDPTKAIDRYHQRILFLHLKDVEKIDDSKKPYRFVELGRGQVDIPAVFAALKRHKFHGWAIVELDGETDKTRTPKESASISKEYLEGKLGVTV